MESLPHQRHEHHNPKKTRARAVEGREGGRSALPARPPAAVEERRRPEDEVGRRWEGRARWGGARRSQGGVGVGRGKETAVKQNGAGYKRGG